MSGTLVDPFPTQLDQRDVRNRLFQNLPPEWFPSPSPARSQPGQIPELDLCFDIGRCPKAALASPFVALTHGHMDHSAGIAYYYSQRHFQGMDVGTIVCHPAIEQAIHNVMRAWVDLEAQRTPYKVVPLEPDKELQLKNNLFLRAFATNHTVPSLGFIAVERRSKLKPEFCRPPPGRTRRTQEDAGDHADHGHPAGLLHRRHGLGPHFDRQDVLNAKVLVTECTFLEPEHRSRAAVGKHLHLDDIVELLARSKAEAVVLTHLSRRTNMGAARKYIDDAIKPEDRDRLFLLMDSRTNRARFEQEEMGWIKLR